MKMLFLSCEKQFSTARGMVKALRKVDLEVREGEFFIFLGPSGCGKSTLLNVTAGLEKLTGGEIHFNDQIVDSPSKRIFVASRERNVAMVFQSYALYPHLNVFENIAFPLRIAFRTAGSPGSSTIKGVTGPRRGFQVGATSGLIRIPSRIPIAEPK